MAEVKGRKEGRKEVSLIKGKKEAGKETMRRGVGSGQVNFKQTTLLNSITSLLLN